MMITMRRRLLQLENNHVVFEWIFVVLLLLYLCVHALGAASCMLGGECVVQLVFVDVDVWDAGREHLECTELCSEQFDYTAVIT